MDRSLVSAAAAVAIASLGADLSSEDAERALCGSHIILRSTTPTEAAKALATTWLHQTQWRGEDPRARVQMIVHTGREAARLRSAGFDGITAFAHGRSEDPYGHGLLIGAGLEDVPLEDMKRFLDAPDHVRIVIVTDRTREASILPPVDSAIVRSITG